MAAEASVRERLALCESTRGGHVARIDELEQEVVRLSHQLLTLASRAGDSQQLVADTEHDLQHSQASLAALQQQIDSGQRELTETEESLGEVRGRAATAAAELDKAEREAADLKSESRLADARRQTLEASLTERDQEAEALAESRDPLVAQSRRVAAELDHLAAQWEAASRQLDAAQQNLALDRAQLAAAQKRHAELSGRLTGARERTAVLEELEARLEGLASGAKEVLRRSRDEPDGPFRSVRGVVADLLHVDADTAPLVEIALGERANHLVVAETKALAPALADEPTAWPGRTTFLRLDVPYAASAVDRVDLAGEAGVMGRADQFVEATSELAPLVRRLLGRHWFVDSLTTALHLAGGVGRGLNFVTVAGEAVLADGTLAVGPRQSVAGMLSRRSELRALADEIEALQTAMAEAERDCGRLELRIAHGESAAQKLAASHADLSRTLGEARLRAAALADRVAQADARLASLSAERGALEEQVRQLHKLQESSAERERQLFQTADGCRSTIRTTLAQQTELERRRGEQQRALADERVELARVEQRVEGLARQMEQLVRDHAERDRSLEDTRARAVQCQAQRESLQRTVLELAREAEQLRAQRGGLTAEVGQLEQDRRASHDERTAALGIAEGNRAQFLAVQARLQAAGLQLQQCRQARDTIADRLRDDYGIELAGLAAADPGPAPADRSAVEAEIRDLREHLQACGPVNLEAIAELAALEGRSGGLAAQYDDLQQARTRLEHIVQQINGESRQLFLDAVAEIRGHFQEIFRRLFGGGEADLVLEDDPSGDVLECGVSIVACPPGKQPRNISLLSGGERTLTCVALLLAIFRSRPCPFCILDEVDAALDEANIDRFVGLLKEFMTSTQFIVITHSKRTMTCADTLHGITMQESGVSKRVSVRFEDVGEDGRIRASALRASDATPLGTAKAA
jgi:chromosome segregation protein